MSVFLLIFKLSALLDDYANSFPKFEIYGVDACILVHTCTSNWPYCNNP